MEQYPQIICRRWDKLPLKTSVKENLDGKKRF